MTPWARVKNLETATQFGLFLDYITPTMPEILWYSLKNRDFAVAASTSISNFITVLIIVSTSLLNLEIRPIRHENVPYRTTSRFTFDVADLGRIAYSSLPMDLLDAMDDPGLPYPVGTTDNMVYQTFEGLAQSQSGVHEAVVDAAIFDVGCKPAELEVLSWRMQWLDCPDPQQPASNLSARIKVPDCSISPDIWYSYADDGVISNFAFIDLANCGTGFFTNYSNYRFIFGVGQAEQHGTAGAKPENCSSTVPEGATIEVLRSKQWICQPTVALVKAKISYNASTIGAGVVPDVSIIQSDKRYLSPQVNQQLMASFSTNQANTNVELVETSPLLSLLAISDSATRGTVNRILRLDKNNSTITDLLQTDLFSNLTQSFWKRLQTQSVHAALTTSQAADGLIGSAIIDQQRLVVRSTPLRIMQAFLAANLGLILFLVLRGKRTVLYDYARLFGVILVLRHQRKVLSLFKTTGHQSIDILKKTFITRTTYDPQHPAQVDPDQQARVRWWRPMVVTIWARSSVFLLALLLVAALEVLLYVSNRKDGLADVTVAGNQHLAWSTLPAVVMTAIAIYFRALGSNYKLFSPYQRLRRDASWRALFSSYSTSTDIEVVLHALIDRQYAVACVSAAVVISTLLTIVVSGVWTPSFVEATREVQLGRQSWFSVEPSSDDGSAGRNAFLSGIILGANASYPKWTHGDLAIASISTSNVPLGQSDIIDTRLPAVRSLLNCTLYSQDDIPGLEFFNTSYGLGSHSLPPRMEFDMIGPGNCTKKSTYVSIQDLSGASIGWAAFLLNSQDGCPSLNYLWGRQEAAMKNVTFMRAMSCYESIDQVDVHVSLTDQLDIDASMQPTVLEDTARTFSHAGIGLPYDKLPRFDSNETAATGIWAMLTYKYGIQLADLGKEASVDSVVRSLKSAHGIIRAQQYNAALRTSGPNENGTDAVQTFAAQIRTPQRYRLVQNGLSTHLLCALLATMVLFGILASWLMSTNYVLPKNPGSIGAAISILADSDIFEDTELLEALGTASGRRRHKTEVLNGRQFRMGWFDRNVPATRVFTINCLSVSEKNGDGVGERLLVRASEEEENEEVTSDSAAANV